MKPFGIILATLAVVNAAAITEPTSLNDVVARDQNELNDVVARNQEELIAHLARQEAELALRAPDPGNTRCWHCMMTSIYSIAGSKTNAFRACRNNPCAGKDFNGILRNANTYAAAWMGWDNWKAGNSWFDAWDRSPT